MSEIEDDYLMKTFSSNRTNSFKTILFSIVKFVVMYVACIHVL